MRYAAIGGRDTVRKKLREFAYMTKADEIMVTANIYDQAARQKSFAIAAELFGEMNAQGDNKDCA